MVHDKVTISNLHEVIYMVNLSHVTLSCNSCNMKMYVIEDVIPFQCVELRYPDTQPHIVHPTDDDIMHKVHFEILFLHTTKFELFLFWRHHNAPHHVRLHLQARRVPKAVFCILPPEKYVLTPLLFEQSCSFSPHHTITIACRIEGVYAALLLPVTLMATNDHRPHTAAS